MSEKTNTCNRKMAAGLTGRIKQHHVLSSVDAAFLCERCCDLLCALVKLHAGRRAHCCSLEDSGNTVVQALTDHNCKGKKKNKQTLWSASYLGIKENKEDMVWVRLRPPVKGLSQILMLWKKNTKVFIY